MLLQDFDYRVETSKCDSMATRLRTVAEFEVDVSHVFPYLNARFQDCEYSPLVPAVRLKSDDRIYAIHRHMIVTGVNDFADAQPALAHIREVINDTWERRSEITPREQPRARASALEVLKSLPKTNCGDCGEKTCMAFAVKLASGEARPEQCVPLNASARERLQEVLG